MARARIYIHVVAAITISIGACILLGCDSHDTGSAPASDRALENFTVFARLYGYVRYFHPSDEADAVTRMANWDRFLIDGLRRVETAGTPRELADILDSLFRPIAPTVRMYPTDSMASALPDALQLLDNPSTPNVRVVMWKHQGFAASGEDNPVYGSQRVSSEVVNGAIPDTMRSPHQVLYKNLGGGVTCMLPVALFASNGSYPDYGTHPRSPNPGEIARRTLSDGCEENERLCRLAAIIEGWNAIQHFYPYASPEEHIWRDAMREAMRRALHEEGASKLITILRCMLAPLDDGHAYVLAYDAEDRISRGFSPPFSWSWAEDQLVVESIFPGGEALKPGDIIQSIDGVPIDRAVESSGTCTSTANPRLRRYFATSLLLRGDTNTKLIVGLKGSNRQVTLHRTVDIRITPIDHDTTTIREVRHGIYYINLGEVSSLQLRTADSMLAHAKGIVVDARRYPTRLEADDSIIEHFIDDSVTSATWRIPLIELPDRQGITYRAWTSKFGPIASRYSARVAFLADYRSVSALETILEIVDHYDIGPIVGETTAGANGNVASLLLPGNYRIHWTGMQAVAHDSSFIQRAGISPTVRVEPTIESIREGRDVVLERAVELVSR